MNQSTVGIIGLGAMGAGIAKTLRNNGFTIHVCDVRPGVAQTFVAEGGTAHATAAALAAVSDVVVSVVVNAAQTESVLFGENGAAAAMRAGSTFVMCSTVDPNWSVALEARLNALGLHYVDAPISGGAAKAATGQMTMMTAAKPDAYAAANAVLDGMAARFIDWAIKRVQAAKSRSSTSCSPVCTLPWRPKPWHWACAKAWMRRHCMK